MANSRIELLRGLNLKQRAYVIMCVTNPGMTTKEMAKQIGVSEHTLSMKYNGNTKLQDIIATMLAGQFTSLMPLAFGKFKKLIEEGDKPSIHLLMRMLLRQSTFKNINFDDFELDKDDDEEEEVAKEPSEDVDDILKEYEV